jgi:hypothetical protein
MRPIGEAAPSGEACGDARRVVGVERAARRRFDHLVAELSVALGIAVPRHALWLAAARHLESAARSAAFCGAPLDAFLADEHLPPLRARERARLAREIARFDPSRRTPEEVFGALFVGEGA